MPRTTSQKTESVSEVTVPVGVSEIEVIVAKAIAAATEVIRAEFDRALQDFDKRLSTIELKVEEIETSVRSPATEIHDLTGQIEATRKELRQFALAANDSEQYSRRNNLRIKGLNVNNTDKDNCRKAVVNFIRTTLSIPINEDDIELAHLLPVRSGASSSSSAGGPATEAESRGRAPMLVRFRDRSVRDNVISRRKILKGSNRAIVEDLTNLNVDTMNRLRKNELVEKTWSWNGHIYAQLRNGRRITVRPFEIVS
jgi:hypothetical protein